MGAATDLNAVAEPPAEKPSVSTATTTSTVPHHKKPKATVAPQVIIIPAMQASTTATNAAKKLRRAFSMPRNPFRWSRKFKTSQVAGEDGKGSAGSSQSAITACVGGGRGRAGSIVSLNSYELVVCKDTKGPAPEQSTIAAAIESEAQAPKEEDNRKQEKRKSNKNALADVSVKSNGEIGGSGAGSRVLRRSSFRKFLNRIAHHVSATVNVGTAAYDRATEAQMLTLYGVGGCWRRKKMNKQQQAPVAVIQNAERVPPIGGYQWPPDQTPGVMGLKNHGNTCFMNAVLQCLSHTDILAEYFVLDQYKADLKRRNKINSRKFGTKGELTEQLANVLKALWTCKNESDHSTAFKAVVDRYGTQFRSSTQHDAQEFLFWLLDKVHEDLNTATKRRYKSMKNTYGRPDEVIAAETLANHIRCNNSFVQAVFQAQFRSSLTCPRCRKQSNTFDPFHCVSVQLPQLSQQTIFVTVVYLQQQPRQLRLGLSVPAGSPIVALREMLQTQAGVATDRIVLADLNSEGFARVFYDTQPVATLKGIETIYCIEMPAAPPNPPEPVTGMKGQSNTSVLLLLCANVRRLPDTTGEANGACSYERFGSPFTLQVPRDCSYADLQKLMLRELAPLLQPEVFTYATALTEMFRLRLQDPSADPDTYLQPIEHPLLTEMIELALSVLNAEAGPPHIKLLLEWSTPEEHFDELGGDTVVDHESVPRLLARQPNETASLTLEQCLEHYTKAETLSAEDAWRCPHCQQYLPVVKTLGLWSLPDILVVHFKRFRQHQGKQANAAKLTTMVQFPLHAFDMSPHLARDDGAAHSQNVSNFCITTTPWKRVRADDSRSSTLSSRDNKETRYDLYAVCYHQGDTLETGHYTAACKNPYDREWYKFDDQRVNKVPSERIQDEIVNNEAYMLFYQRRSSDAMECSASSSSSGDHWVSRIAPLPAVHSALPLAVQQVALITKDPTIGGQAVEPLLESLSSQPPTIEAAPVPQPAEAALTTESIAGALKKQLTQMSATQTPQAPDSAEATTAKNISNLVNMSNVGNAQEAIPQADTDLSSASTTVPLEGLKSPKESDAVPSTIVADIAAATTVTAAVTTNSSDQENGKSPANKSSSPVSSYSARVSPRSLAGSAHGAMVLQNEFNGHAQNTATASITNCYGDTSPPLLSSSLKETTSSSIIGSAVTAHEYQLSRYQQKQQWHGSRSSVSAVEFASTAHATHSFNLRHSFSNSSNYKLRDCSETLSSMLRNNSANTCSKDTLIYIDHKQNRLMEDDDYDDETENFMGSRALWISPVTPHKLITVSPKN